MRPGRLAARGTHSAVEPDRSRSRWGLQQSPGWCRSRSAGRNDQKTRQDQGHAALL